jgi:hypothetical protein
MPILLVIKIFICGNAIAISRLFQIGEWITGPLEHQLCAMENPYEKGNPISLFTQFLKE